MQATQAQIRALGTRLGNGNARIVTLMSDGPQWPDGTHYYVIEDLIDQITLHVATDTRPTWTKYLVN